jgi:hypothetical protein
MRRLVYVGPRMGVESAEVYLGESLSASKGESVERAQKGRSEKDGSIPSARCGAWVGARAVMSRIAGSGRRGGCNRGRVGEELSGG